MVRILVVLSLLLLDSLCSAGSEPRGDGWDYLARGKPTYARTAFKNQVRRHPDDVLLRVGLGLAHLQLGSLDEASEHLLWALRKDPDHAMARRALAATLLEKAQRRIAGGRRDEQARLFLMDAADQAQRAIDLDPTPLEGWVMLAQTCFELGDLDRAETAIAEIERRGGDTDVDFLRGLRDQLASKKIIQRLADAGPEGLDSALISLRKLIDSSPNSIELRLHLGDVLVQHQQWPAALDAYRDALQIDPYERSCLDLLLTTLPYDSLRAKATTILEETDRLARSRAAAQDPRPAFARYCLAQARLQDRRWAEATPLLREAMARDASLTVPCGIGLGDSLFRAGDYDASTKAYLEAIRDDRAATIARVIHLGQRNLFTANLKYLADRAVDAKATTTARDLMSAAIELKDRDAALVNNYAFLCRETGEFELAAEAYGRLVELRPQDPRALNDAALILHYHLDHGEQARVLYERALSAAEKLLNDPRSAPATKDAARSARKDARDNLRKLDAHRQAVPSH